MIPPPKDFQPTHFPSPIQEKRPFTLSSLPTPAHPDVDVGFTTQEQLLKSLDLSLPGYSPPPPPPPNNLIVLVVSPVALLAMPCLPLFNLTLKMNPTGQCSFGQL